MGISFLGKLVLFTCFMVISCLHTFALLVVIFANHTSLKCGQFFRILNHLFEHGKESNWTKNGKLKTFRIELMKTTNKESPYCLGTVGTNYMEVVFATNFNLHAAHPEV